MKAITYLIRLTEPLLATQANSGEPNSAVSFPYVPGSMIRGALIRQYLNGKSRQFDLAANDEARELFFDGQVQYLNAYPYDVRRKQRLLPKPFSWFVEKDALDDPQAVIHDFAIAKPTLDKPKSPRGEFVELIGGNVGLMMPERQINVHNFTAQPGRKQEGVSQVYRYDALAAGQTFAGAVVAVNGVDLSAIEKWLNDAAAMVLGGSHTGGYGRVEISSVKTVPNWTEFQSGNSASGRQILTFLSDAIIRTPDGQVSAALARLLGLAPKEVKAFQKTRVVGGFNRKWGLPLPQTEAIQAGSVFCLPEGVDTAVLQDWVENGVGERRAEGYGRVALNWHTQPTRNQTKIKPRHIAPPQLTAKSKALAKQMANRRLRSDLERKLAKVLEEHRIRLSGLKTVSPSQLSRVRLAARHALAQQDLSLIQNHVKNLTGAKKDWEKVKFSGKPLLDWIVQRSQMDETEFKKLFGLQAGLPKMAGVASELQDETSLEVEFRARLIDGVMKLAVKESQKQEGGR